jgi:hypothetical protein
MQCCSSKLKKTWVSKRAIENGFWTHNQSPRWLFLKV